MPAAHYAVPKVWPSSRGGYVARGPLCRFESLALPWVSCRPLPTAPFRKFGPPPVGCHVARCPLCRDESLGLLMWGVMLSAAHCAVTKAWPSSCGGHVVRCPLRRSESLALLTWGLCCPPPTAPFRKFGPPHLGVMSAAAHCAVLLPWGVTTPAAHCAVTKVWPSIAV